ncbi:MAG TPA: hypothetical protein VD735_07760 [Candidatus Saccharimonadales bacterium]|nr:hypothetical protein [Candidatus Saccharimonadales bacterium]
MATFHIHQKITAFANQYRVFEDDNGKPGKVIAYAHQKRLALKEKIIFYTDETKQEEAFHLQARNIMELAGTYDVKDGTGEILGVLRKQFKASLLRSTWHVSAKNNEEAMLLVQERSTGLAIARRVWGFVPYIGELPFFLKYHFDFVDLALQQTVASYTKVTTFRDHYALTVEDATLENLDWRVLVAQGVALDALQSR